MVSMSNPLAFGIHAASLAAMTGAFCVLDKAFMNCGDTSGFMGGIPKDECQKIINIAGFSLSILGATFALAVERLRKQTC